MVHTSVETSVDIQLGPNSEPNKDPLDLMMFGQIINQLICSICKKKFNQKSNRTTHLKRLDTKRPFYCKRCSRGSRVDSWRKKLRNLLSQESKLQKEHDKLTNLSNNVENNPYQVELVILPDSRTAPVDTSDKTLVDIKLEPNPDLIEDPSKQTTLEDAIGWKKPNRKPMVTRNDPKDCDSKNRFKCTRCTMSFRTINHLRRHSNLHNARSGYECKICKLKYKTFHGLKQHELKEHDKSTENNPWHVKPVVLPKSRTTPPLPVDASNDTLVHVQSEPNSDSIEDSIERTTREEAVNSEKTIVTRHHQRGHGSKKKFECTQCPKTFWTRYEVKRHYTRQHTQHHVQPEPNSDSIEDSIERTTREEAVNSEKSIVTRHHHRGHGAKKKFECTQCPKSFWTRYEVKRHYTRQHTGSLYECKICKLKYKSLLVLKKHELTDHHENLKSMENNSFQLKPEILSPPLVDTSKEILVHVRLEPDSDSIETTTHEKVIDLEKCIIKPIVTKRRHRGNDLKKKFKCSQCTMSFLTITHLRRHSIRHDASSGYECKVCKLKYKTFHGLKQHMLKEHNESVTSMENNPHQAKPVVDLPESHGTPPPPVDKSNETLVHVQLELKLDPIEDPSEMTTREEAIDVEKFILQPIVANDHPKSNNSVKIFSCTQCAMTFQRIGHLKRHSLRHNASSGYECGICNLKYKSSYGLKQHQLREHDESDKSMEINPYETKPVVFPESLTAPPSPVFISDKTPVDIRLEPNSDPTEDPLKMMTLEEAMNSEGSNNESIVTRNYRRRYDSKRNFKCSQCPKTFWKRCDLKRHFTRYHTSSSYDCKICKLVYKSSDTLKEHELRDHDESNKNMENNPYQVELVVLPGSHTAPVDTMDKTIVDIKLEPNSDAIEDPLEMMTFEEAIDLKKFDDKSIVITN